MARDLADLDGNVSIRKEEIEFIDPGSEKEFYNALMEVSNFLKHADKDPHGVLTDFDERRNDLDLFSCTLYLSAFGKALSPERRAFLQWGAIVYPELFKDAAPFQRTALAKEYPDLKSADRQEQLAVGNRILRLTREALAAA